MKAFNKIFLGMFLVGSIAFTGCTTSDLDPTLEQDKDIDGSINTAQDMEGILKGAYNRMTSSVYYGRDFIINNEVRTDNTFANGNSGRFSTEAAFLYTADNNPGIWTQAYSVIATANILIGTDLENIEGDQGYAKHVQGQAYAIRALAHFDLLKQYGEQTTGGTLGIPYITEFKSSNTTPSRNTVEEVKAAIFSDLNTAFSLMGDAYFDSSKEFMSRYTAKAIESRVAIYFGMWNEAKSAAEAVINSGLYQVIAGDQFVASYAGDGSQNSIFELAFSNTDNLGGNSLGFIYKGDTYGDIEVLPNVEDLYTDGDVRLGILGIELGKLRNLGKYPDLNGWDNVMLCRYEEVILNYAEALFETGGDAASALNMITSKRGIDNYTTVTKEDILNERRRELIFEGFRYDDLMRTNSGVEKVDFEQNISESIPAGDYRLAMPIPIVELDANANMVQNRGY